MDTNDILQWGTLIAMLVTSAIALRKVRGETRQTDAEAAEKISEAWEKYVGPLRADLAQAMAQIAELKQAQARLWRAFDYLAQEVALSYPEAVRRAREIALGVEA